MPSRALHLAYGLYAVTTAVLVLLVLTAPLVLLLPGLRLRRRVSRGGLRAWLTLVGAPVRLRGRAHLPAGPCVVVSNHASYLDGPLLTAALPERFTFLVHHGAARWPVAGRLIKAVGVSFVERESARAGAAQLRALARRLRAGESFTIFPEGTFRAEPALLPFQNGAFLVAAHAGVPIVPAVLRGTRRFLGDGQRLPRPARIEIELLAPIMPSGSDRAAIVAARDAARSAILARCGESDAIRYPCAP